MKISVLDRATLGSDIPLDMLASLGELTVYDSTLSSELADRIRDAEVIVLNKVKITAEALEHAECLKLICVTATGYDNIDVAEAKKRGIAVTNVPGYSTDSVVLFTVATVLSLVAHLPEYNKFVTDGSYTASGVANRLSPVYHEIRGMTWGIIGYGNIGKAVGDVAKALGARVIVNKRNPIIDAECVDIDQLCKESDIITVHCPLNSETHKLINGKTISLMKPNVVLVNEARGGVIDSEAVAKAIEDGSIGAFGADVYEVEPLSKDHPFNRIMKRSNVLLTPHSAWGAYESRVRCLETVARNISAFSNNKSLNRVDILGQ